MPHIYTSKRYASMRVYLRNYRTFNYINQHFSFSSVNKINVTYSVYLNKECNFTWACNFTWKAENVRRVFIHTSPRRYWTGEHNNAPTYNVAVGPSDCDVWCCITTIVPLTVQIRWKSTAIHTCKINLLCMRSLFCRHIDHTLCRSSFRCVN